MPKIDLNSGKLRKGTEVTSREVMNVLVLLQISIGGLYAAIASLGLVALRKVESNPSIDMVLPERTILVYTFWEGVVMIVNGYFCRLATKKEWIQLLAVTMFVNLAIVNFNSYELANQLTSDRDYSDDICGIVLLWIFELIYYFIILYYSTRLFVTFQSKLGTDLKAQAKLKDDSTISDIQVTLSSSKDSVHLGIDVPTQSISLVKRTTLPIQLESKINPKLLQIDSKSKSSF